MDEWLKKRNPRHILAAILIAAFLPFLALELFRSWCYRLMDIASFLVFHNLAEFFSVMVSLSIFGVGWFTYNQTKNRHSLFLCVAFLAIGLIDFLHTLSYAGMPAFITPNTAGKATRFWIAARFFSAVTLLVSAGIYADTPSRWISRRTLMMASLAVTAMVFTGVIFFPQYLPVTFVPGVGLTPFKKSCEFLIICLLLTAFGAYWKRMSKTGDRLFLYYLSALILCTFSELAFAIYKSVFDTYNVLGHLYKVAAFYLIYRGVFASSVEHPYLQLNDAKDKLLAQVAERRRAEEALRVSEERFQLAMMGANEGLWDWNVKLDQVYYSPRWKSMLGYADEELENQFDTWKRLVHPQDLELALAQVLDALEGHIPRLEAEFRMRHKEGHYLDILSSGFPIHDDNGEALRLVGTHVDVTERRKLEQQYRQAQKMKAVGQLAGGVAHDFNNILSAIFGYSQLILDQVKKNDPVHSYTEEIIEASKRAAALSKNLLAFSRKQAVTLAVIDLSEVVSGFEAFLRRLTREDIELKISCSAEPLSVMADRGQIEQVIMNLVTNARDAMPNGGTISIDTRPVTLDREFLDTYGYGKAGAYGLLSVSDSGVGMGKETQARMFEPFFTTKEQGKGTGLGLSMAYGIVKKHDGFINAYSEPKTGSIFKIYLPRVEGTPQIKKAQPREATCMWNGTETILLGEDDEALRRLATRVLSHYGYQVIEAEDGQDALNKFHEFGDAIELVILDLVMPRKNGKVALDEMKMLRPMLKAIITSGYTRDIVEEDTIFDEYTDFMYKPISPDDLVAKVREMLDKNLPPQYSGT